MTRQIKEAIRAQNRPSNLNSKGEFGANKIARLVIEPSEFEKRKEEILKRREIEEEDLKLDEFLRSKKPTSLGS